MEMKDNKTWKSLQERFGRYPDYRESGSAWIGKIPTHWVVRRLKYIAKTSLSGVDKHSVSGERGVRLCNYTDVYKNDVITSDIAFMEATASQNEIERFTLSSGDVLVTKDSEDWRDIAKPAYVPADLDGVLCGYHLALVRPHSCVMDGRFLARCFSASGLNDQFRVEATGVTRFGVGTGGLESGRFPVPPLEEQGEIADFLDRQTTWIDALIGRKKGQIKVLEERRAALIKYAVTQGVPVLFRGILPEDGTSGFCPPRWSIVQLGRQIVLQRGVDITKDQQRPGPVPVVSSGGITSYHDCAMVHGPGVVVGRKGTAGAVYFIEEPYWPHDTTLWVKAFQGNHARFVYYKLLAMNLEELDTGSANPTLNRNIVHSIQVYWPPVPEQVEIATYLDEASRDIGLWIKRTEDSVRAMNEYRQAVIVAAVSGNIRVRK